MKLTIICKDEIGKSLIGTISAIVEAIKLGNPEASTEEMIRFDIDMSHDIRKPHEAKGRPQGAKKQYRAILPTLQADAVRVINENLQAFTAGTQQARVYRELVKATQEGRFLTKPEVMTACGITVASSAERILGRFAESGLVEAVEIPVQAASD